ncbi:hypothetical protein PILCRDRAFT_91583 [Piloderma croceum F 1598]|uniref:Uncharacterized protein n=1 Tax=Piloderma croceum (strain F 1598) TaxID=765440 RepID=A0A0C3EVF0_PILCF|nr:hypothetical protein PILCRDRAFT_91583 [Piloderma croceum F 1598]
MSAAFLRAGCCCRFLCSVLTQYGFLYALGALLAMGSQVVVLGGDRQRPRLPLLLLELWITPVQHYLFMSAGVLLPVDKKLGIIINHSLLRLRKCLSLGFLTSYKKASTSSSTTLTFTIFLAIAFPHSLSKVLMGYGPVSALYQNSFAARLLRLLSASRKTILLQSEFVTLEVDLLCFSSGGQHPSANEPTLVVSDVSRAGGDDLWLGLDLEIRDDLLAVLGYRLSIFAWKTGQNIVCFEDRCITAFRFLSDVVIVVADITERYRESLDLFTISDHTPITRVARLWLDDMDCMDDPITTVMFANRAAKNGVVRSNLQIDAEHYIKPFTSLPDNLIYICITSNFKEELEYAFIVHSLALLCHAKEQDFDSISWEVWGRMATLAVSDRYRPAEFCGQRLLMRNGEIWDFNQYRVKRLGKGFAAETELARISVVAEEEKRGLAVIYSLPYVRIVLKQRLPLRYGTILCLDEDHILAKHFSIVLDLLRKAWNEGRLHAGQDLTMATLMIDFVGDNEAMWALLWL